MVAARDLELRHLHALDAVAKTGTFGRAADLLGYTQSAISQQIAALERVVGEPVFDRPGGPRPVELTPVGALLAGHARELLERVRVAAADVDRFRAGVIGRIDVGTFQSISVALLPSVLGRLSAERPQLEARLMESDDETYLAECVIGGDLDLSFLLNRSRPELEKVELFVDPFVAVAPPRAVGSGPVPIGDLADMPLIGQQQNACQRLIDDGLRERGVVADFVFRSNDNNAVINMVKAGMGTAVMPLLAVDPADPAIAVRPLDPPIPPRHVTIGWRRDRTLSPAATRFIELAQEMSAGLRERELAGAG